MATARYSINPLIEGIIKDEYSKTGDIPAHERVIKILEKDYPDAIDKYLATHRVSLVSGAVTRTLADQRNGLRNSELAVRIMDGSTASVFDLDEFWGTAFFISGDNGGWKTLGSLTGSDHSDIADKYRVGAIAMSSREDLHRDLAKMVGRKTTIEVFKPHILMRKIESAYDTSALLGGASS